MGREAPADRLLVRRFAQGCQESFDILVSRYEQKLFGIALALLEDTRQTERIILAVFLRLARQASRISDCSSVEHFLLRTLKDQLLEEQEGDSQHGTVEVHRLSISDKEESTATYSGALARLPLHFSFVFVLRHVSGKKLNEIAAILDIAPRAAHLRLTRSYRLLARLTQGSSIDPLWRDAEETDSGASLET